MKKLKLILIILGSIIVLLATTILIALAIDNTKAAGLIDDYSSILADPKYQTAVSVENAKFIKQDISCGYAVIEMFGKWTGNDQLTEASLYDQYGKVVTSTGASFEKEMNTQFPAYKTTMYKNLKASELIDKVYDSLKAGMPVPFEWAAKLENEWTLHYSLVTSLDAANSRVTIQNPYGYEENIGINEFIDRTSFHAYENMPLFLQLGFAFGMFERNTIFIVEAK
ncbi:hypothetical protein IK110_04650 [Candidatus Saccharibacteria bacterium]|nr:hypothetical protein [Candidatus Saccharibacteria bacterium]